MKLYDATAPNPLRVNVFLAEKGIDVARVPVDVRAKAARAPEFRRINSRGEVPVLETAEGVNLAESVAICRYFEALHPEPPLFGRTPLEQGLVEMWNRRMELLIFQTIANVALHSIEFFADKVEQVPDYAATQRRAFLENWDWLDAELADGRTFVADDQFSVADITGMAALFVADLMEVKLPAARRHARRWEEAVRSRRSFAGLLEKAA